MYPGAVFLQDFDVLDATPGKLQTQRWPPNKTRPIKVGGTFLDDDDDDEEDQEDNFNDDDDSFDAQFNHGVAKSLFSSPLTRSSSLISERSANEGRYKTEFQQVTRLGRGGFGSVDLVRNKLDRSLYAVKKIRFKRSRKDGRLSKKLMREVLAMTELRHPNIVRYHGSWIEDDLTPHGTPSSSRVRGVKLFEFDDDENSNDDEYDDEEDDDEYGESQSQSHYVNADEEDEEDESNTNTNTNTTTTTANTTHELSTSGVSPFPMEEEEEEEEQEEERHRGRSKKREPRSPKCWTYGTLYIQMQYYEETLDAWLDSPARKNHVCCHVSRDIFMQIVEALHYIHSKGYIHRDLKPANIFLTPRKDEGSPVSAKLCNCEVCSETGCGRGFIVSIGDFGLSTLSEEPKAVEDENHKPLHTSDSGNDIKPARYESSTYSDLPKGIPVPITASAPLHENQLAASVGALPLVHRGVSDLNARSRSNSRASPASSVASSVASRHTTGVGSLSYASPEQISGQFYDEKTDVFSLGIICYQLFSPPFVTRMERAKEFAKLRNGTISATFAAAHPKEAEFICRCVSANPEDRPSTTDILAMDIWEPAACMCLRDSSLAVTIPRSMFKRMQDEINRLQRELALTKEMLAKQTDSMPPPLTPRVGRFGTIGRSSFGRSNSSLIKSANPGLPGLFDPKQPGVARNNH